ncbi:MAG: Gfo/Idh/MocA family oxidoreductase [Bacteroidota bacterium]
MLKIGVLGAGHLGKIHIKLLKDIKEFELVGFYDPDHKKAEEVSKEFNIKFFSQPDDLYQLVDSIDIVTPTISHFECATRALKLSKHLFIEKPITNTIEEAEALIKLSHEANVKVQIGHVERFNPAYIAALPYFCNPMFIETHRLALFNPRGTDVPVVLDLMIHDLDIVLSTINSNIKKINASGVAVVSDTPDIANARLEFDNGCVANLTASRISMKNMRKSRFFQKDSYISVDFLTKEVEILKMKSLEGEPDPLSITIDLGNEKGKKEIIFEKPKIIPNNAIREELLSFYNSINENSKPLVCLQDGYNALNIAYQILEKMKYTSAEI